MNQLFKVFYSWQSDLPGNKTRYFIQEAIDTAISIAQQSEKIEAERDEATKGKTGSPNIVDSIYSKIEQCDLFVADLSICFSSDTADSTKKRSPNPNVLIELGYAARALGWERIICFCNTDYGEIDKLPFDIQHNRITGFSLNSGKTRQEVLLQQASILTGNICALRNKIPRSAQKGAYHILGSYNSESESVEKALVPLPLHTRIDNITEGLRKTAASLYRDICEITQQTIAQERQAEENHRIAEEENRALQSLFPALQNLPKFDDAFQSIASAMKDSQRQYYKPVVAKSEKEVTAWLEQLINVTPCERFFDFGSLAKNTFAQQLGNTSYEGTELEKEKYQKYRDLVRSLFLLWIRIEYIKTFDGMLFFPIAIQNASAVEDNNIRVVITVTEGTIVVPSKDLIIHSLAKYAGQISEEGIIEEIFSLPDFRYIEAERVPFDGSKIKVPSFHFTPFGNIESDGEDESDYERKLTEYIMSPSGQSYYTFDVSVLRPGESRWLCSGVLLYPSDKGVTVEYKIYSSNSTGEISGTIHYDQGV